MEEARFKGQLEGAPGWNNRGRHLMRYHRYLGDVWETHEGIWREHVQQASWEDTYIGEASGGIWRDLDVSCIWQTCGRDLKGI